MRDKMEEPEPGEFLVPGRRLLVDRQQLRIGELESLLDQRDKTLAELLCRCEELEARVTSLELLREQAAVANRNLERLVSSQEARIEELEWELAHAGDYL